MFVCSPTVGLQRLDTLREEVFDARVARDCGGFGFHGLRVSDRPTTPRSGDGRGG